MSGSWLSTKGKDTLKDARYWLKLRICMAVKSLVAQRVRKHDGCSSEVRAAEKGGFESPLWQCKSVSFVSVGHRFDPCQPSTQKDDER